MTAIARCKVSNCTFWRCSGVMGRMDFGRGLLWPVEMPCRRHLSQWRTDRGGGSEGDSGELCAAVLTRRPTRHSLPGDLAERPQDRRQVRAVGRDAYLSQR